jgi:4-methyl-5(b-hydroxyethyl)-thiazole monophosphate biosynthesis
MIKKILVAISDGIEEIETVCVVDTLVRAGAEVVTASVGGHKEVLCSRGVRIHADHLIDECIDHAYDMIVLPGGMPGAEHLRDCDALVGMLKKQKAAGKWYAAICASPALVLQTHGLLEGLKATCYPSMLGNLSDGVEERVVVDGKCVTSQGPGTAMEFALMLVEVLYGVAQRNEVARAMLVY